MNTKNLGIVVVIIGILMMVYTGFHYVTTQKLIEFGPIEINKEKNHSVQWTPIIGLLVIIGGVVILKVGNKKHSA
ncbi:MAG: hypothetical protein RLZZ540_1155 [Bacteroidota bacterium]|jgi:uncharacterized membrane protein YqgA involved in biofilm formation